MKFSTGLKLVGITVVILTIWMTFSLRFPYWLLHIGLAYFSAYVLLPIAVGFGGYYYFKSKFRDYRDSQRLG